jgi:glycosyltransferase involved in cell wall biosynthesis
LPDRILILTQYFPPEVGAPQNRLFELGRILSAKGMEVTVLTAMPNYPEMVIHKGYRGRWTKTEEMGGMRVVRSWIYATKGRGVVSRLLNYFSFVFSSFIVGLTMRGRPQVIMCESPPLFLGMSAIMLSVLKGAKMVFNVSDLWPESAEKLGIVTNKLFLSMATALENFCYSSAKLVTGQTQGIVRNIQSRFRNKPVYWLKNGVDSSLFDPASVPDTWRSEQGFAPDDVLLLYAGIHGHAQGLEVILHAAEQVKDLSRVKFVMVGDGPEKRDLLALNEKLGLTNVHFFDVQPKPNMPLIVKACDMSVVPLRDLELFRGAIPSKIFEILAMERPILLGVLGEAKEIFIDGGGAGLAFQPEDAADLARAVREVATNGERIRSMGQAGRRLILEQFDREKIAAEVMGQLAKLDE